MNDPAASGQPGAGPNIDVRWVCWRETLHGVNKLALREGASVTLDPNYNDFLCQQTLSRQTTVACCPTASSHGVCNPLVGIK